MGTKNEHDFAARQSWNGGTTQPARPLQANLAAPTCGGSVPSSPHVCFPPMLLPWQIERAALLHRFCQTVDRRRAAGVSVRKAVKYFAWFWKDRPYRTAPHIKARFSRPTLVALFYRWRRAGKSPDCFALHYSDRLAPVTAEEIRRFADACARADTVSFRRAVRLAGFEASVGYRILARLPGGLIQGLKGIFKDRRQARIEAEGAIRKFKAEERRRLATERARGRKAMRLLNDFIGRRGCGGVEILPAGGQRPRFRAFNACFRDFTREWATRFHRRDAAWVTKANIRSRLRGMQVPWWQRRSSRMRRWNPPRSS